MIELFDRVKLIEPYKLRSNVANELIPAGTVGTYRKDMKDSCIIQIDETRLIPLPEMLLTKCDKQDLSNISYRKLTPKIFHPGNIWSIVDNYDSFGEPIYIIGKVSNIQLETNELYDKITLSIEGREDKILEKRYLENFCSYTMGLDNYKLNVDEFDKVFNNK
jgi:hypothetical protein